MKEEFRVNDIVELNGKQGVVSQIGEDGTILATFSYSREQSESGFPTRENIWFSSNGFNKGMQTLGKLKLVKNEQEIIDNKTISKEEHIAIHERLHQSLDDLLSDFIKITGRRISGVTVMELLNWSYEQTKNPTDE